MEKKGGRKRSLSGDVREGALLFLKGFHGLNGFGINGRGKGAGTNSTSYAWGKTTTRSFGIRVATIIC